MNAEIGALERMVAKRDAEIERLKEERDSALLYGERLRTALKKIISMDRAKHPLEVQTQQAQIARDALAVYEQSTPTRVDTGFGTCDIKDFGKGWPAQAGLHGTCERCGANPCQCALTSQQRP